MGKKTMKIIALEIDEFDLTSGVDRISLVESPATEENFHYFKEHQQKNEITDEYIFEKLVEDIISEEYVDDLPEEIQENILEQLESVGETEEELRAAGWIKDELGDEHFIIQSTADLSSLEDSGDRIYRYQYRVKPGKGAPIQNDTRSFCRKLISMDKLYRKEDINKMTYTGENSGFAQKGSLIYDIFKYAGGKYCRHQWVKIPFKKSNIKNSFAEQDREKQMVVGPIMVPKKLIYRYDVYNGEYWVYFTEDTIEKIAHKYLINNYQSSVNIDHQEDNVVEDVTLVESWLVEDPEKDKSYALMGKKYPKGTWFGTMKINNKKVWNEYIKEGKVLGWSVEGYFADKMINQSKQTFYYRTTEGGTEIVIDENTLVVFILKDGERAVTLPDGEYKLTNGETLVVEDSKAKGNF